MENPQPVDQLEYPARARLPTCPPVQEHPAITLITARPDIFTRQGSVSPTWRHRNGRAFGPYYRLSYRDDGRQCAIYLGRDGPLVQRVRHLLQKTQNPLRQKQIFDRIERETRAALRTNNARLAMLLRPLGLRLKGYEVRGWRTSLLKTPLLTRPVHLTAMSPFSRLASFPQPVFSRNSEKFAKPRKSSRPIPDDEF